MDELEKSLLLSEEINEEIDKEISIYSRQEKIEYILKHGVLCEEEWFDIYSVKTMEELDDETIDKELINIIY